MDDILSYILGKKSGKGTVILEDGDEYEFTDANSDGHVVITKKEE